MAADFDVLGLFLLLCVIFFRAECFVHPESGRSYRTSLLSTKLPIGSNSKVDGVTALQRLLERQKEEVKETERLLSRFQSSENGSNEYSKSLSTAESIISGFDYGFQSRSEGANFSELKSNSPAFWGYGPPANLWRLGTQQFMRNLNAMKGEYQDEEDIELSLLQRELQAKLENLTLNSTAIWERELSDGPIEAPLLVKVPYLVLCYFLDTLFEGRYVFYRFFFLETVARMPYFSYITMLHLYETLGFWRRSADVKRIHFAEELNEFHHLLIMESLGGDQAWWVRFMAQHSAIAYYIALCFLWGISPTLSYRFSELLETHAVNTYGQFLDENEALLKELPPSFAAIEYYAYGSSDPFFSEFQTTALSEGKELRRPGENMRTLYDVIAAIQADERDHVSTMQACLDPNVTIRSLSMEKRILFGMALVSAIAFAFSGGGELAKDAGNVAGDATAGEGMVDAAIAGAAAFSQNLFRGDEEGKMGELASELKETGGAGLALEGIRRAAVKIFQIVAEFLAALL